MPCPKCQELAAEIRQRLAVNRSVGDELDDLLSILEEPDEDDPVDFMRRNLPAAVEADQPHIVEADEEEEADEPEEPTPLDIPQQQPSANGKAKPAPAAATAKDDLQVLAEQCPRIIRSVKDERMAHLTLRLNLGDIHHKTADAAIRRAMDQGLITTQKIDGLTYYVIPPKGA